MPRAEESPCPAPSPTHGERGRARFVHSCLSAAPFVVPLLYLAVVLCLQPPDYFGDPEWAPATHHYAFDDHDLVALALRAYNAELGRHAGRLDEPESLEEEAFARQMRQDGPRAERYYLEYPHSALLLFRLGFLGQDRPLPAAPAAFCDGYYMNIVWHRPRPEELELWRAFRRATRVYVCLMTGCLLLLVLVLRRGYEADGGLASGGLLLLLPGALLFALCRFDVVPALLTAAGLACLGRRWWATSALCFAVAALIKVYPVLLVPLVLRYLGPSRRAVVWLSVFTVTVALVALSLVLCEGAASVWAPYRVQLARKFEPVELTFYDYILPASLADNTPVGRAFRLGALLLALVALLWRRPPDLAGLLRRCALLLIAFVSLAVFYSPQWVVWLAPFLLPLARRQLALACLIVALDVVSYYAFLRMPEPLALLVYARFVVLGGLVALLLRAEWARPRKETPCAEPPPNAGSCASP